MASGFFYRISFFFWGGGGGGGVGGNQAHIISTCLTVCPKIQIPNKTSISTMVKKITS